MGKKNETALSIAVSPDAAGKNSDKEQLLNDVVSIFFLEYGADPNTETFCRGTPLHDAAKNGYTKALCSLCVEHPSPSQFRPNATPHITNRAVGKQADMEDVMAPSHPVTLHPDTTIKVNSRCGAYRWS